MNPSTAYGMAVDHLNAGHFVFISPQEGGVAFYWYPLTPPICPEVFSDDPIDRAVGTIACVKAVEALYVDERQELQERLREQDSQDSQ